MPDPHLKVNNSAGVQNFIMSMRRSICLGFAVLLIVLTANYSGPAQPRKSPARAETDSAMSTRVLRSVAVITTYAQKSNVQLALGSGFAVAPDLIITNLHVFAKASSATVKFTNSTTEHPVTEVVGLDLINDLCAVRILNGNAVPLPLGSRPLTLTEEVFAFGNPEGLEGTVSKGIISSLNRGNGLIQIDAPISHGSSGGPVVNKLGEVVGVVVSMVSEGQNLNFAIPADRVRRLDGTSHYALRGAGAMAVSDRDWHGLRGPVVRWVYSYPSSDSKTRVIQEVTKYNDLGNLAEHTKYSGGEWLSTEKYTYDADGFLVGQEYDDSHGERKTTHLTRTDAIAKRVSERPFGDVQDGVTYDALGRPIEGVFEFEQGSPPVKVKYVQRFRADGLLSEMLEYRDE